jgi:prolyl-tRNA synthetase
MKKFNNFSKWFDGILLNSEIVDDRYPIKGFAVFKSWGAKIVRNITKLLEKNLELTGHKPMLFPVVISEDAFAKEAEHIKGFNSEVFWITKAGNKRLNKKLLLRPTSETAIYPMFSLWIRSHADLPIKIYQSVPVYRYETKSTRPLLRSREFLWNEVHTAHKKIKNAENQIEEAIKIYSTVFDLLCINFLILKRPDFDKFAGAKYSLAFDAWNPDGRVNQIGTIHYLSKNFSKAFNIKFEDENGNHKFVTQTCYGFGISRTLAAILAQHGDDHGMILPPKIAPIQVVIIPIYYKKMENEVKIYARKIYEKMKKTSFKVYIDESDKTPGEKFYYWEKLGIPLRIEVGPRDYENNKVTFSERINLKRFTIDFDDITNSLNTFLIQISNNLIGRSHSSLNSMINDADSLNSIKDILKNKRIARVNWCEKRDCAEKIKEHAEGEVRGYRIDIVEKPKHTCIICGEKAKRIVYVAKTY